MSLHHRIVEGMSTLIPIRTLAPLVALVLTVALVACADVPTAPMLTTGLPLAPGGNPLSDGYRLAAGDEFEVRFAYYPDLNDRLTIGPDGHVSMQLINDVQVGGLSASDAAAALNRRYASVLRDPKLSLTVRTYSVQELFVTGWVLSPGVIRTNIPLTVSRVLAQAGGIKVGARYDQVLLVRRSPEGTVHWYQLNLANPGAVAAGGQDVLLQPYDLVYVPQTKLYEIGEFISNTLFKMLPSSFAFAYGV